MTDGLRLGMLRPEVAGRTKTFFEGILSEFGPNVHSVYLSGSALTEDYLPGLSDINSVIVFNRLDIAMLESLAPFGRKFSKKKIAAPLIMTPEYISHSLDAFPVEFLNLKLVHETIYGPDLMDGLEVARKDLRLECEREVKARLIGLRQGFVSSLGDRKLLHNILLSSIPGYVPLLRAVIFLYRDTPPVHWRDVIKSACELTGIAGGPFREVLRMRTGETRPRLDELKSLFEEYYSVTERLSERIDGFQI